jgi:hypothetical protein
MVTANSSVDDHPYAAQMIEHDALGVAGLCPQPCHIARALLRRPLEKLEQSSAGPLDIG